MSKTKEELDALKEEINKVNEKICELTPEELEQFAGGVAPHDVTSLPGTVSPGEHSLGSDALSTPIDVAFVSE